MDPLISIMTPFYNASGTLPDCLKSLKLQTYENWECILVDDGSTDDPLNVINQYPDQRFKLIRLEKNMGRGVARQIALDNSQGDFLCFLDADDWIYPHKLSDQLEFLRSDPMFALISSGMAVMSLSNELIGIQGTKSDNKAVQIFDRKNYLSPRKIPTGPMMIRMELAKQARFDPNLKRAQDADFLQQILHDHRFGLMNDVLYAYRTEINKKKSDVLSAYASRIQFLRKYKQQYPFQSNIQILFSISKWLTYYLAFELGFGNHLLKTRFREPSPFERAEYQKAYNQLVSLQNNT